MNTEVLVYDLISFEWSTEYDFSQEPPLRMVRDDSTVFEKKEEEIKKKEEDPKEEVDADGIPMGTTTEAFRLRQRIITDFWIQLKEKYPELKDRKVYNVNLKEYIYIVHRSFEEAIYKC